MWVKNEGHIEGDSRGAQAGSQGVLRGVGSTWPLSQSHIEPTISLSEL